MARMKKEEKIPTRLFFDYMVFILPLSLQKLIESMSQAFFNMLKLIMLSDGKRFLLCFRPVDHCGLMSAAALTTALAYAPESMQALSFPERLRLLFRVSLKVSSPFYKQHGYSAFPHLKASVFSIGDLMINSHL